MTIYNPNLKTPPVSLIGAIESGCFIRIMPAGETNNNIRQCAGRIRKDNPMVFFLGAGSSSEANIPMGPELCRKSLEQLLDKSAEDDYNELVRQFWKHVAINDRWLPGEREIGIRDEITPLTFERVIREQICQHGHAEAPIIEYLSGIAKGSTPSPGHLAIAELILKGYRIVLITTNYDNLIEQALNSYGLKLSIIFKRGNGRKGCRTGKVIFTRENRTDSSSQITWDCRYPRNNLGER
jgi:hypothetical protein